MSAVAEIVFAVVALAVAVAIAVVVAVVAVSLFLLLVACCLLSRSGKKHRLMYVLSS